MKCIHCGRRFRSKAAQALADRRRAILLDLQGIEPAEHLRPTELPTKRERHLADSAAFRAGQF